MRKEIKKKINIILAVLTVILCCICVFQIIYSVPSDGKERNIIEYHECALPSLIIDDAQRIHRTEDIYEAIDYFYKLTGIRPMIMTMDGKFKNDDTARAHLRNIYERSFEDNKHMIICIADYGIDAYEGYIYVPEEISDVMDDSAVNMIKKLVKSKFRNNYNPEVTRWDQTEDNYDVRIPDLLESAALKIMAGPSVHRVYMFCMMIPVFLLFVCVVTAVFINTKK